MKNLIFLWCIPRSISTAFEKMMASSGRYQVYGEPFIDIYKQSLISSAEFSAAKQAFEDQCAALEQESRHHPVFVKDMAYHALPFISDELIHSASHTFLTRSPQFSIPSLYKMRKDFTQDQPGFEGQYLLFEHIRKIAGQAPFIMDGEALKTQAETIIPEFFAYLGHEMPSGILNWSTGSREEWKDREAWHLDAINSQNFQQTTSSINPAELPDKVISAIANNDIYYQKLIKYIH